MTRPLTRGCVCGALSTRLGFTASSLDDQSVFRPSPDMWTRDAQPWDVSDPQTPRFPGFPPRRLRWAEVRPPDASSRERACSAFRASNSFVE